MNKVLPLVKSHWIILVCLIVPIGAIVAGYIFSSGWNASIKERVEQKVQNEMRQLEGLTQTFEIPQLDPRAEPIRFSMVPNRRTVEIAGEKLKANIEQSDRIYELAVEFNSRGKELLIDGPEPGDKLFPVPDTTQSRLDKLARLPGVWREAHRKLLADVQAGGAPDPARVAEIIDRFREQEQARFLGDRVDQTLSEDEQSTIDRRARERRAEIYRTRAAELAFYTEEDAFPGVFESSSSSQAGGLGSGEASASLPEQLRLHHAWEMQHRYWVHEEIMRGLKSANTESDTGFLIPVHRGAVKRVVRVDTEDWDLSSPPQGMPNPTDASREIPRDYSLSITGLTSWPERPNQLYDVREVEVTLHVDSGAVNRVIEALKARNFIKVIDADVSELDEMMALRAGYDYGTDHVVSLTLDLQTVWLREWTKDSMPPQVRTTLGIPQEAPTEEGQSS